AGVTISFTGAATLGNGFKVGVFNNTNRIVTLDPAGTETINGYTTTEVYPKKLATIYSDGTNLLAFNDIPQPTINPFVNSDMVFWPLGPTASGILSDALNHAHLGAYVLDGATVGILEIERVTATGVPSILNVNPVHAVGLRQQTTAGLDIAAYTSLRFVVEGNDFRPVALRPFGVSFAMRSSLTGTYNFRLKNAASNQFYGRSFVISSVNTFEYKSFRIPSNPGTWDYSIGTGIVMDIILAHSASVNVLPSDSWTSVSAVVVSANVNFAASLSASCRLTALNMWQGEDPYNWKPDDSALRVARENRLYFKTFARDTKPAHGDGTAGAFVLRTGGNGFFNTAMLVEEMRGITSATVANNDLWNPVTAAPGAGLFVRNITAGTDIGGTLTFGIKMINVANLTAQGSDAVCLAHFNLDARFEPPIAY
ncbi:MAG: hypothetical protein ACREAG_07570, partial [Nitrosopumilaceae archaeon]